MGTVDFKDQDRFERRIGRRVKVDPVQVTWVVPQTGRFGRKRPPVELPGRIENVSITGAAIVGPADLDLAPGSKAVVRSRGRDSIVVVRHRSPIADSPSVRFGVELPRSASVLRRQIQELLDPMLAPPPGDRHDVGPRLGIRPGLGSHTTGLGLPRLDGSGVPEPLAAPLDADHDPSEVTPAASSAGTSFDHVDAVPTEVAADADTTADGAAGADGADGVVLDLTDGTLAARGEPVVELSGPATALVEALRALEPILVDRSVPTPPEALAPTGVEPEALQPEADAPTVVEPDAVTPTGIEADAIDGPATTTAARTPRADGPPEPIEPPDSLGRRVLDDVFRLMGD